MEPDVPFGFVPLGEVAELVMGSSPPGESYNETGDGLPLINGPAEYGQRNPVPVKWTTAATRICNVGDVLICVRGNTTGRLNLADREYCIGRGVAAIRAKPEKCAPAFLWWILEQQAPRILAVATGAGTTFPNINKPQIAALPIPQLPVSEQHAIARILDAADAAIERTREAIAKARRVKRGLVQTLFTTGTGHTAFRSTAIGRVPASWSVIRVSEAITEAQYGLSMPMDSKGEYPILRMAAIQDGDVLLNDLKYVDLPKALAEQYLLRRGDVLFNRTNSGELVGKVGIYRDDAPAVFASYLIRLKVNAAVADNFFLGQLLASYAAQYRIKRYATPGVQQVNINATNLQRVLIAIPSGPERLREQRQIAEILEKQDDSIRQLEARLAVQNRLKRGLMQDLLTGRVRVNGQATTKLP